MTKKMEKGQSLVLVTLLLFAFFAILALVLDGGFVYYLRRNAQNAADAGALAGADDLCKFGIPSQAEAVAEAYAFDNGVSSAVASATLMNPGGIVEVNTSVDYQTFFARMLNIDTVSPPAFAKAGCAPPEGAGVMPIAWSCRESLGPYPPPEEPSEMDECAIKKVDNISQCTWPAASDKMYIIADSDEIEIETLCISDGGAVDCDLNDDGSNDLELLVGGDRSWLDLNGDGGGAAELIDWIEGDSEDLWVVPHTWVPVQTGVTGSVYTAVVDNILNERVVMPIFDLFCPDGFPPQPGCPVHAAGEAGSLYGDLVYGDDPQDYYHIIALSYWVTTCVDSAQHGPCPGRDFLNTQLQQAGYTNGQINSLKTMEGCFVTGNVAGIGGTPGQGIDTGLYTIFLME